MKILIADDSKFMRGLLRTNVEALGHEVIAEAENGQEAIDAYMRHYPDLVMIDMVMPVMGGLEAIDAIMAIDSNAKIVMCSSMGHASYVKEAIIKGVKDFIVKPFRPDKIKDVLSKIDKR